MRFAGNIENELLVLRRQPVEHLQVHGDDGRAVVVDSHGAELRHFVDPERIDIDDGQIAAVDHPLLGRRHDLAPGHRYRIAAEASDGIGKHLGKLDSNLATAKILGLDDWTLVGPEVTVAVVVEEQHLELVLLLELLIEALADLAVEHGVSGIVVLHQIWDEEHTHLREDGRRRTGRTANSDVAGLDGIHDLQFLRDQRAAMEFYGECAVGPRIELLGHPIEGDGTRFRRRNDVRPEELPGRRLRVQRSAARGENARKTSTSLQQTAAGHWASQFSGRHAYPPGWT